MIISPDRWKYMKKYSFNYFGYKKIATKEILSLSNKMWEYELCELTDNNPKETQITKRQYYTKQQFLTL